VADEATIVAGGYGYMEEDFSLSRCLEIVWWNTEILKEILSK
jgi:hypothetical protein